jgi:hypothetical protein
MNRETKSTNQYLTIASLNKALEMANRMDRYIRGLWGSGLEGVISAIRRGVSLVLFLDLREAVFRRKQILSST